MTAPLKSHGLTDEQRAARCTGKHRWPDEISARAGGDGMIGKWDRRMMGIVNLVALWSKDPSTGVGAAIVDGKNRFVSLGFNGFPRAVVDSDEALMDRDEKLRRTIHAEENALLFAGRSVEGCTIYLTQPMTLAQKLDILGRVKSLEADLRAYRLASV